MEFEYKIVQVQPGTEVLAECEGLHGPLQEVLNTLGARDYQIAALFPVGPITQLILWREKDDYA